MAGRRVVVLGGGMAGLTTAWELSSGPWRDRFDSITVYQRGWRLGGKGASSRGAHGRIEEHGLHVLLGYYDATFRVLREVYAELDRGRTDPDCPLRTWQDALVPSGDVGLVDAHGPFVTRLSGNGRVPGEPGAEDRPLRPLDVAVRALRLLVDFHGTAVEPEPAEVYLSTSPHPRRTTGVLDPAAVLRAGALSSLAAMAVTAERLAAGLGTTDLDPALVGPMTRLVAAARDELRATVRDSPGAWRTWELVDLVSTTLLGMATDGLLTGQDLDRIDHLDLREWLARHGASPTTLDSPVVRGMYDLALAYEDGDRSRPRFAAGLGLQLAGRMLFDCKGAVFWRMQAGMGEVVFAPLYQALARRGVEFRFFRRLDQVQLSSDGRRVSAVHLTRQAEVAPGSAAYQPLVRHQGLPCWPAAPLADQLVGEPGPDLETHPTDGVPEGGEVEVLQDGRDFDVAVLAVSLGMVPHVAGELVERIPAWGAMCREVATVATMAAQLWLDVPEEELGWRGPAGVTLSGFGQTFDTWASMPHLLPREEWPRPAPRGLAYFCGAMPDAPDRAAGERFVRETLTGFLESDVRGLWPAAADGGTGFRWHLLHDEEGRTGSDRLAAQYVRANLDPSDRYVQSLPGTGRHRIAPGTTGLVNLAVAGDWTACGLDAGCLEAAVRSGVLAARAVRDGALGDPAPDKGPR
jgi:uncharacterized protein with NAD-binding domain and iron-sulfur cluster